MSIVPVNHEFGRSAAIDNRLQQDYLPVVSAKSPSRGKLRKGTAPSQPTNHHFIPPADAGHPRPLRGPSRGDGDQVWHGVVTIGALIGMAAHLDGTRA